MKITPDNGIEKVIINAEKIQIKIQGSDYMVYKTDINTLAAETGMTVKNISFPIEDVYIVQISNIGKNFECGKIIENIFTVLKQEIDNQIIIADFNEVETISEEFSESWAKVLLSTNNKIIPINMNINIMKTFSMFVEGNFKEVEE